MVIVGAFAPHEIAEVERAVDQPEAEPVHIEIGGRFPAFLGDHVDHMAEPDGMGASLRDPPVQAWHRVVEIEARLIDLNRRSPSPAKADGVPGLVPAVQRPVRVLGDLAVAREIGGQRGERVVAIDAPYRLAQGRAGLVGLGQTAIVGPADVDCLVLRRNEHRAGTGAFGGSQSPILEKADSGVHILDAERQRFDALYGHSFSPISDNRRTIKDQWRRRRIDYLCSVGFAGPPC